MDYESLKAGRELDALVLEKIFLFPRKKILVPEWSDAPDDYYYIPSGKPRHTHMIDAQPVPAFSTSITAAWLIVEEFRRGWRHKKAAAVIEMTVYDSLGYPDSECKISAPDIAGGEALANEMPLAICLAALKAVEKFTGV